MKGQGNTEVAAKMQSIASELKSSQGGSASGLESTDHSCNAKTDSGHGYDLTGHGSGKGK